MNKFLERHIISKLTSEEIDNQINSLCINEIEFVVNFLLWKERERERRYDFYKKPDLYGFTFEFQEMLKR